MESENKSIESNLTAPSTVLAALPGLTPEERAVLFARASTGGYSSSYRSVQVAYYTREGWVIEQSPDNFPRMFESPMLAWGQGSDFAPARLEPFVNKDTGEPLGTLRHSWVSCDGSISDAGQRIREFGLRSQKGLNGGNKESGGLLAWKVEHPEGTQLEGYGLVVAARKIPLFDFTFLTSRNTHGGLVRKGVILLRGSDPVGWVVGAYGVADMFKAVAVMLGLGVKEVSLDSPGMLYRLSLSGIFSTQIRVGVEGPPPETRVPPDELIKVYRLWVSARETSAYKPAWMVSARDITGYTCKEDADFMRDLAEWLGPPTTPSSIVVGYTTTTTFWKEAQVENMHEFFKKKGPLKRDNQVVTYTPARSTAHGVADA